MDYSPINLIYAVQETDQIGYYESRFLLPEVYPSRDEARKLLASAARRHLNHSGTLHLCDGELDGDCDKITLIDDKPNYGVRLEVMDLEFYNTFEESQNEP